MHKKKSLTIVLFAITAILIVGFLYCAFYKGNNETILLINNRIKEFFAGSPTTEVREKYNFNYGWRFAKGEGVINSTSTRASSETYTNIVTPTGGESASVIPYNESYDESTVLLDPWKDVSLPHTYNDEDTFDTLQETNNLYGERSMYGGTAWYKKEFYIPNYTGKRVIVEFEAARQAAKVYVNGVLQTGTYENGFIAFGYDITDDVVFGQTNNITVMVDNSFPYKAEGTNSNLPWHDSHWHPNYGGLYRNSSLYIVDDLHLTLPLYSFTEGTGTYVYTSNEADNVATINVHAEVENNSNVTREFSYKAIIKNMSGDTVLEMTSQNTVTLNAGAKEVYQMSSPLLNPVRWSDKYPYLYTAIVQIIENGEVIDNNSNTFGIRTFNITNDFGFYLNKNYTELNGWGQKSTMEWAGIGAAYPNWMQDKVIKLMKDANATFLRWGHVAGSITQTDITDKYGLVVLMPGVDAEGNSSASSYDENSMKVRINAMRDMIISMRNHPSIMMWEIGNHSSSIVNSIPANYLDNFPWLEYNSANYTTDTYGSLLNTVINQYDYGNRSNVINSGTYDSTINSSQSNRLISVRAATSANDTKITEYIDMAETTQGDGVPNATYNSLPVVEGEYNRLEVRRGVWDNSTPGFETFTNETSAADRTVYANVTNESFAKSQITWKKDMLTTTKHVGGGNWIFSDSNSHGRVRSEVVRASGEVDGTMLPKGAYYVDQTIFGSEPSVYIIGHWNYPTGTIKDIFVAGKNVASVELLLNDTSLGFGTKSNDNLYTFDNISYATGTLTAKGYNSSGDVIVSNSITTHGAPYSIRITPITRDGGAKANGSDIVLYDVELLDSNNNRCITFDGAIENESISFTYDLSDTNGITGYWLGGYNSAIPSNTHSDTLNFEAGITRVAIRTSKNSGNISLTATMGTFTDTETISTSSISSDEVYDGLSSFVEQTPSYTLIPENNIGVGSGVKLGIEQETSLSNFNSLLIKDLEYNGTIDDTTGVYDAFNKNSGIYSDVNTTLDTFRYQYVNAELIKTPNADVDAVSSNLVNFSITRDVDVVVFRDSTITNNPSWLSSYTDTGETVTGSNDVTYKIYKKSFVYDSVNATNNYVEIGSNTSDGVVTQTQYNQFIIVKETSKITSRTFFNENFDDIDDHKLFYGFGGVDTISPSHIINKGIIGGKTGVRFYDSDSNISYLQKSFAPLDKPFDIEFSVYISDSSDNRWIRAWVTSSKIIDQNYKENLAIESYFSRSGNGTGNTFDITYRSTYNGSVYTLGTGYNLNTWYRVRYNINPITKKFIVYVYNENTGEWERSNAVTIAPYEKSFTKSTLENGSNMTSLDNIVIGSGVSYKADFYVDDLIIHPTMSSGVSSISVNGNTINVNDNITSYTLTGEYNHLVDEVEIATTDSYLSHTIDYVNDKLIVTVLNQFNNEYVFEISFSGGQVIEGITIVNPNNSTDVSVRGDVFDNEPVIHVKDNSSTDMIYFEHSFDPIDTIFSLSYDIYSRQKDETNTITYDNKYLRSFITSEPMGVNYDANVSTVLGVHSFINKPDGGVLSFRYVTDEETIVDDYAYSLNTWHNLRYEVDVINKKYDIYLDDVLVEANIAFYRNNLESLSNLVVGSGGSGTQEFYVKNIEVIEGTAPALNGVIIGGMNVEGFDNNSALNYYYSNTVLTNDTSIELVTNPFYVSTQSIVKDLQNQKVTISVVDNVGGVQTYIIEYSNPLSRVISKSELNDLILEAQQLNETDYTFNTWAVFDNSLTEAISVYNDVDAIQREISLAYYDLERDMGKLLGFSPYDDGDDIELTEGTAKAVYTDYQTSLIDTIFYSNNLTPEDFKFNKVLENGALVYNDIEHVNFTWSSVPYKYMNAEYLVLNNTISVDSSFTFTALHDIDMLIFKDWNSGPLTEEETNNLLFINDAQDVEPPLVDTEEIAVAKGNVDGELKEIVYYVYKKSFNKGDVIRVDGNMLLNNDITHNNSIIGFIESSSSNNERFFYENIDKYIDLDVPIPSGAIYNYSYIEMFKKSWTDIISFTTGNTNLTTTTKSEILNDDSVTPSFKYIHQYSEYSNTTMPIIQKKFAKLNEGIKFEFDAYLDNTNVDPVQYNRYIRVWLTYFTQPASITSTGNLDRLRALGDTYLDSTRLRNASANFGDTYTANAWHNFKYVYDIKKQKYTAQVDDGNIFTQNFINTGTNALYSANHVYFAGRGARDSEARFKNIYVSPIPSNVYDDILISLNGQTSSLGCGINTTTCNIQTATIYEKLYQDLTNSYLYKTTSANDEPIVVTSNSSGTLYPNENIINNIDMTNYSYAQVYSGEVVLNNSTYSRDYNIYYEVEDNGAKNALVNLLDYVYYTLDRAIYTAQSWSNLLAEVENAETDLANHKLTSTEINQATSDLQTAINALMINMGSDTVYTSRKTAGKKYDEFLNSNVNITNKSSFTINYNLEARTPTNDYPYNDLVNPVSTSNQRYLITDVPLPEGTTITFIDHSNNDMKYYYVVTSSDSSKIKYALSDFRLVGTDDVFYENIEYFNSTTRVISENFDFIFDFVSSNVPLTSGAHTIALSFEYNGQALKFSENSIYTIYSESTPIVITTSLENEFFYRSDEILLSADINANEIIVDGVTVTDTTLEDKIVGMKFTLYDSEMNKISFPKGSEVTDGLNIATLASDGTLIISAGSSVTDIHKEYTISSTYRDFIDGDYFVKLELLVSYDGINNGTIVSNTVAEVDIVENPNCAIDAYIGDDTYVVNKDLNSGFNLNVHTICNNVSGVQDITVSLYKKSNAIFSNFNYDLIDYAQYISTGGYTLYDTNIYTIKSRENNTQSRTEFNDSFRLVINENMEPGLYKVEIDIRTDEITKTDYVSFVVK